VKRLTRNGNIIATVARGLKGLFGRKMSRATDLATPPSIRLGRPLKLLQPSNAKLFELLDEESCNACRSRRK
jgi:hypothetical protein